MSVLFFGVRRVPRYEKDWFSGALAGWWFARQGGAGRVLLGRGLIKKGQISKLGASDSSSRKTARLPAFPGISAIRKAGAPVKRA